MSTISNSAWKRSKRPPWYEQRFALIEERAQSFHQPFTSISSASCAGAVRIRTCRCKRTSTARGLPRPVQGSPGRVRCRCLDQQAFRSGVGRMSSGMTCSKLPIETMARGLPFCDVVIRSFWRTTCRGNARCGESCRYPVAEQTEIRVGCLPEARSPGRRSGRAMRPARCAVAVEHRA